MSEVIQNLCVREKSYVENEQLGDIYIYTFKLGLQLGDLYTFKLGLQFQSEDQGNQSGVDMYYVKQGYLGLQHK